MTRIGAIVLAAGRASRFRAAGGLDETKLVTKLDGKPIVRMALDAVAASRARPIVVVTGHARRLVEDTLAGLPTTFAFNPDFATGLASSLKVGVAAMPTGVTGAVILLGDMPRIEARLIDALIEAFEARPHVRAAAPWRAGRRGNPVLLSRALFEAAMRSTGDEGARRLVDALDEGEIALVAAPDDGAALDIDTPADLVIARRLHPDRS